MASWPEWPHYGLVDDLLPTLEAWQAGGQRFALATLVAVQGSSPRPVGSEMAISERGLVAGYVSGGCVEAAVAEEARAVLEGAPSRLLDYGAGSPALDIQLSCGGRIQIWLRCPDEPDWLIQWRAARSARLPLIELMSWQDSAGTWQMLQQSRLPPLRLVAVGGDPVTLALVQLAESLGMEVWLLRPKGPHRPPPGLRLGRYDRRSVEVAVSELALDRYTAVYALTHDADTDHVVLNAALRSPAFCVGALGSRRKAELRRQQLRDSGLSEARLQQLHSPAGLDLGGHAPTQTPMQIALSIVGQIVAEQPR